MDSHTRVRAGAKFTYTEAHYHGPHGGIQVLPASKVVVEEGARYRSTFSLVHGRVGTLDIDFEADVADEGHAEITSCAYGSGEDDITVRETVRLNGSNARGLAKTRIAVRDRAHSRVFTTAEGNAPFTRGHMDCTEIVRDEAVAENVPQVIVRDDQAQITHEAAIGTVNRKELETLMTRGLDEDAAVDVIIHGMLGA
jgi:Fe-S cluster assembly scaffold protein SufB